MPAPTISVPSVSVPQGETIDLPLKVTDAAEVQVADLWTDWGVTAAETAGGTLENRVASDGVCTVQWDSPRSCVAPALSISVPERYVGGEFLLTVSARADGVGVDSTASITISDGPVFLDPYSVVDWDAVEYHIGDFHTQTENRPDDHSSHPPEDVVDEYDNKGYSIVAITEHDYMTWPWSSFGRDPDELGMVAVQGCEASSHHHLCSLFNGYDGYENDVRSSLDIIGDNDGLAHMNHPGLYDNSPSWYVDLFNDYDYLVGMEVHNRNRYDDRALWDEVLHEILPERNVWGFANDDTHGLGEIRHTGNVFPLESLDKPRLRSAMENGRFLFWVSEDRQMPEATVERIAVDETEISVEVTRATSVRWKTYNPDSEGTETVTTGTTVSVADLPESARFVRMEVDTESGALLQTQAFPVLRAGDS